MLQLNLSSEIFLNSDFLIHKDETLFIYPNEKSEGINL
jgi:hypothetical protein